MVCISCIVIPVFIWAWYRFIQPLLISIKSYFYPSIEGSKTENGTVKTSAHPDLDTIKSDLKCPFTGKSAQVNGHVETAVNDGDKKTQ